MSLAELASALGAPMYALPVDIFRILAGFVGLEYFRRAFAQTSDFSSVDGLIDHEMSQRLFPPTDGRYWTRTSDPYDVNVVLYQLS